MRIETNMEPVTLLGAVVLSSGASSVNIANLAVIGVGAVIALLVIFGLVQAGLSVFQTRAMNNQVQQGIQAIVGVNNMDTIDRAMENNNRERQGAQVVNNNGGDGDGGNDSGQ